MRSVQESRKRWNSFLSGATTSSDLRARLEDSDQSNPCEDGLRSVCWKAFLLFDGLEQLHWSKVLVNSRSAYSSLREHFLKFIENPDDLESTVDPLTEDENSPWQSLRRDETIRAEIFQDVERCLQDNYFFREPSTQKILLDILFIYSKLNQDTGYRQGMHEILAPILWVVERDAIDPSERVTFFGNEEADLMLRILDSKFIEHDAFSLFCVVMQTAKSFYEVGDQTHASYSQETTPIVMRSRRIHQDLLGTVDPQLANHLQVIEILPQIFVIRWIRLLFGREFSFGDVLLMWDILFAERLNLNIIDLICVAMLLRIRWQLMVADYSSALTLLLRYPEPKAPHDPPTFVKDALYLQANLTRGAGSSLISKYSGRAPTFTYNDQSYANHDHVVRERSRGLRLSKEHSSHPSPGGSPRRILQQQRGLENLFHEVSGGFQRRSETWGIAKTVRGAVSEVRKNVQGLQSSGSSPRPSGEFPRDSINDIVPRLVPAVSELTNRIKVLEDRNKVLAKMLGSALEILRSDNSRSESKPDSTKIIEAVARIQFVQVYMEDPSIAIPPSEADGHAYDIAHQKASESVKSPSGAEAPEAAPTPAAQKTTLPASEVSRSPDTSLQPSPFQRPRPALAQTSFSWMLGEDNKRQSSFVTSSLLAPDERRNSGNRSRAPPLFGDAKSDEGKKTVDDEDDGFTLDSLKGDFKRK